MEASELSPEIDLDDAALEVPPGTVLALPGKKFPLDFAAGEFRLFDVPLLIKEQGNSGLGTGLNIWDGAPVLAAFLEYQAQKAAEGKPSLVDLASLDPEGGGVLEVGAGTGVVGIAASLLGSPYTVITDLAYSLDNARANVELNRPNLKGEVVCEELDWFKPENYTARAAARGERRKRAQVILGADVVWIDSLIDPLVKTLKWLVEEADSETGEEKEQVGETTTTDVKADGELEGGDEQSKKGGLKGKGGAVPLILIAHQTRALSSDRHLFSALEHYGFDKPEAIPHGEHHPRFQDPAINIFRITRRNKTTTTTARQTK